MPSHSICARAATSNAANEAEEGAGEEVVRRDHRAAGLRIRTRSKLKLRTKMQRPMEALSL